MALFNFLKNILQKKQAMEIQDEELSFDDIPVWIKKKQQSLEDDGKIAFEAIHTELLNLISSLEEKIPLLEAVAIDDFKADPRAKLIVKGNMKTYVGFVKRLQRDLSNLSYTDFQDYTFKIDVFFVNFFKKSDVSYQKTSFLVGKEAAAVKDALVKFYKQQKKIFEDNQHLITTAQTLSSIRSKLDEFTKTKNTSGELTNKIKTLNKNITLAKKETKVLFEQMETIKKSESYLENIKNTQEVAVGKLRLKNEYQNLSRLVDFKALANEFHGSAKHMSMVKSYKNNFATTVANDDGKNLMTLLSEAKLSTDEITSKILAIKDTRSQLLKKEASLGQDAIAPLLDEMKKKESDLETIKSECERESLINEKLLNNQETTINSIKEELAQINVCIS